MIQTNSVLSPKDCSSGLFFLIMDNIAYSLYGIFGQSVAERNPSMVDVPVINFGVLNEKLSRKAFGGLNGSEWRYLMLSILDECEGTNFLGENDEIDCDSVFLLDKKKNTETSDRLYDFIDTTFGPYERKMLCAAATAIAKEAVQFGDKEYLKLLNRLFSLSYNWSCLIDGDLALSVALDRGITPETRQLALYHLVDRDFRSSAPEHVWKRLEQEIEQCPLLAIPILRWYAEFDRNPVRGLEVLAKVPLNAPELEKYEFITSVVSLFGACAEADGQREQFRSITRRFAPAMKHWITSRFKSSESMKAFLTYLPEIVEGTA